jgi:hypothetical protein
MNIRLSNRTYTKKTCSSCRQFHLKSIFLFIFVVAVFYSAFSAVSLQELWAAGAEDFSTPKEGVFVKKYTREELRKILEEPGGLFSSNEELLKQLQFAGLMTEKGGKSDKKEGSLVDLKDFSFHKKGQFEFVRYSKDGKSLFVSYMYPSKNPDNPDNKDYDQLVFNRNVLSQWDTSTWRLAALWIAEENPAKAVTMSNDGKIAIYQLDLYGRERLKDDSYAFKKLKNQLYVLDLTKDDGETRRLVSFEEKDEKKDEETGRTLDNIDLSPDARYLVFSVGSDKKSDSGYQYIVDTEEGKTIKRFSIKYVTKNDPGAPNAAAMVFSPDGKQLARSIPVDTGEGIVKTKVDILNAGSWKVIRHFKTTDNWTGFSFGNIIYSPDGKYLVAKENVTGDYNIFSVSTGKIFCSLPDMSAGLIKIFSPDSKYFLTLSDYVYAISVLDQHSCFWLSNVLHTRSFNGQIGLKTAFSTDSRHIAVAGQIKGANAIQIISFKAPEEKQIEVFRQAERAIELYHGGLKKEGIAMAKEAIDIDPAGLYKAAYSKKLKKAGMPLFLSGELYRRVYEQLSRQKDNRLGVNWKDSKKGITIIKIYQDTPAHKCGLSAGDFITGIGGEKVAATTDFLRIYNELPPDRTTEIEIVRNGNPIRINITPVKGFSGQAFNVLMEFAQSALEAGHPAIAMQAVNIIKGWIREGRTYTDRGMQERLLVVEATTLAALGKESDAFALLIRHNGFEAFGAATLEIYSQKAAFSILLKDRRKLAVAMMVDEKRFPEVPKKIAPQQPYPNLTGRIIEPLTTPPALGTVQPANTSGIPAAAPSPAPAGATSPSPAKPASRGTVLD